MHPTGMLSWLEYDPHFKLNTISVYCLAQTYIKIIIGWRLFHGDMKNCPTCLHVVPGNVYASAVLKVKVIFTS